MVPAGYMAKRVLTAPDWLQAPEVRDIYSVSPCVSKDFADYIDHWKHNGYWFFNSPELIREVARLETADLAGASLFYYEAHEMEFDGEKWIPYAPEPSFKTNVVVPLNRQLEGFDVVTFSCKTSPQCSPLSCNSMATEIPTNSHCLLSTFEEAESLVSSGRFNDSEPPPYRIFAVYSVNWP